MENSIYSVVSVEADSPLGKMSQGELVNAIDLIYRISKNGHTHLNLLTVALDDFNMVPGKGLVLVDNMVDDDYVLVRSDSYFLYGGGPLSGHLLLVSDIVETYGSVDLFLNLFSVTANIRNVLGDKADGMFFGFGTESLLQRLPKNGSMGLRGNYDLLAKLVFFKED